MDCTTDLIAVFDRECQLLLYNSAFRDEIRSTYGGVLVVGKTLSECVPRFPSLATRTCEMVGRCLRSHQVCTYRFRLPVELGIDRSFVATYAPFLDTAGELVGCMYSCSPVETERVLNLTELVVRKRVFVNSVLQTLRAECEAVNGLAQLLRFQRLNGESVDRLDSVVEAGLRAIELATTYSVHTTPTRSQPMLQSCVLTDADVHEVVRSCGIGAHVRCDPTARFRSEPSRLRQCLINIVRQATKRTGGSASICVRVGRRGESVDVVVSDTGHEIDDSDVDSIMSRSLDSVTDTDAVVGFSVTNELCVAIGGELIIDSAPDVGTRVTMRFVAL